MAIDLREAVVLGTVSGWLALGGAAQAQEAAATQLSPVVVRGDAPEPTETGDRLFLSTSASATKSDTPVLETAQSVSTVTRQQLDEQGAQTVGEALRYTAGVLSDRDSNARYDSVFLRGFGAFGTATQYVNFLDGLKLPRGQAFAQAAIDPYLLDRVDVLKGPSALLYGQISPGGLVNQVSRLASDRAAHEILLEGGTHGRAQAGFSSQGALDADGSLLYSLAAIGRHADSRYDGVREDRYAVAPALTWRPSADTRFTLSAYYQKDPDGGYFNSIYPRFLAPAAYKGDLGRRVNIGDPDFDAFKREQHGIGYQFEHRANATLTLRSRLRYSDVDVDFRSLQMAGPLADTGIIPRQALRSIEDVQGVALDNQAQFDFATGAVQHTLLTGLDYQHTRSNWQYDWGPAPAFDVTRPQYGQPIGALTTIIDSGQTLRQTGAYVQDQLRYGGWRATLGVRHDWTTQDTENRLAQSRSDQSSEATSYRAGLLYAFDNGVAPYLSYSTSFEPNVGVDASGAPFVPSKASQYEVGVKYQPTGMDALFTVSAFDIRQRDALVPDVVGFNTQEGRIRSRGLEFEARGQVTPSVELIAALTLLDTKVTEAAVPANQGKRPQAVPRYFGSMWANYRFGGGLLEGLKVGAGVRVVGASYADNANDIEADGYTLVDAALRYDFGAASASLKGLEGRLNVNNLFDKTYYSSCSSNFYCQYGNGRQIVAGLRYRW
ncbi:TonB-dependent siderophore receptor [Bordetella genomosp. 1]|uniref:TonB-dependent siderophore receptor n=1 Tax=Bordetella genomosp. 1 TaxID=1395607 RepID=A0A261SG91_9BORD|nr:TonB-dependent siderophore receptor [Bordetella genomosp. 1]OZI35952.1 TonB-dependent siderophore receptor [Bordetella genomosp. 1]